MLSTQQTYFIAELWKNDKDYFLDIILYNLALVEAKTGSVTGVNLKTMR